MNALRLWAWWLLLALPAAAQSPAPAGTQSAAGGSAAAAVEVSRTANPDLRTRFTVKYVAEGVVYVDGGHAAGLAKDMKLEVRDKPPGQGGEEGGVVADLTVVAVADTSAVCEIHSARRPLRAGDQAYLPAAEVEALVEQRALSPTRKYPAVVSFTESDEPDVEALEQAPRPPSPEINRARGRIGFDYFSTTSNGQGSSSGSNFGIVLRADVTRINGTYWNLSGYWRGRLSSYSAAGAATLQDLLNRTYHLSLTYDNPNSAWVAGFGRLYLPWATSLDTIDGGYFGRKLSPTATLGLFAGSTPDPTSYNYNPDRRIAGLFLNFTGGDYNKVHYSSTMGLGVSTLKWRLDRPFVFFENTLSYGRVFSVYDALEGDSPRGTPANPAPGAGLGRNFLTVRIQPHPRVELDFNHNYFRDVPTFDPTLIGTGLLDKYLFQGFSVGARVEVRQHIWVYTEVGQSNRSGDAKSSLNQMYGVTFERLPWVKLRLDAHYSRFSSAFGSGNYKSLSVSRDLGERFRVEVLAGEQDFLSNLAIANRARFLNTNLETNLGQRYFLQGGFTVSRGQPLDYNQWFVTFGYRFDTHWSKR